MKHRSTHATHHPGSALSRRGFLALCASAASALEASAHADTPARPRREGTEGDLRWFEFGVKGPDGARSQALLFKPLPKRSVFPHGFSSRSYPALLLLHGVGGREGLEAWRTRYGLFERYAELRRPPLVSGGERARFMPPRKLARLNAELAKQPFEGLVLICPKPPAPEATAARATQVAGYCDWVESTLLPRAAMLGNVDDTPCLGLVGYASGAPLAAELFLRKPHLFRTLGLAQPSLDQDVRALARRLRNGAGQSGFAGVHLQTSSGHQQRASVRALQREFASLGVAATLDELTGPAGDASWREAGLLSVLAWHERLLQLVETPEPAEAPLESDPQPMRPPGPPTRS
jgi:hypothetical protein